MPPESKEASLQISLKPDKLNFVFSITGYFIATVSGKSLI